MAGLYLHIPFCRQKCSYCDFYSIEARQEVVQSYTSLLTKHLAWAARKNRFQAIETIYFGGGTPSLLSPEAVSTILAAIDRHFVVANDAEISLEANPGTVSRESLAGYRNAGINRLSLGLQSCNDAHLVQLGRLHSRQEGLNAVRWARQAGFDNLSLDLMFALPGQLLADLEEDLQIYLDLAAEHLSCYGLTAEPQTPLHQKISCGQTSLPEEDFYAEAFMLTHERLTEAGYDHYEIANYSREGFLSRHNLNYWQRRPYLGIGAGAHSFCDQQWGSRWEVPADLENYQQALDNKREPMACLETFNRESALSETVYLALRTQQGISDVELQQRFGCSLEEAFPEALAKSSQWLTRQDDHWSFNPAAWLLFDRLILPFL